MDGLAAATQKMLDASVPQPAIDTFAHYYGQLVDGATGMIPEDSIEPLQDVERAAEMTSRFSAEEMRQAASRTVVIKLNGGLGTSMGMERAKSLLPVRGGRTFLDLTIAQVMHVREQLGVELPLVLMNSFATDADTLAVLREHDVAVDGMPLSFLQSQEPKLRAADLAPVEWPTDPALEWCPPGHGEVYSALASSGTLDALLDAGYRHAAVSNSDNLGAAPDPAMMAWFAATGAPYAAEICRRTPQHVKGGHLVVRRSDGRLILREIAQIPDADRDAAADLERHRYFHTNNLWFDLQAVANVVRERNGVLGLPLIVNPKTVDPKDPDSTPVVQVESAMGAAVEVFEGAVAIEVPLTRFQPVKTTSDLLLMRSDVFEESADATLVARGDPPLVRLDPRFYGKVADLDVRIPEPPSLRGARSLTVDGDWTFGAAVVVHGDVHLADEGTSRRVPDRTRLG
jgi:UTP--glucose-1-phosphate uridylyltransferase